MDGHPIVGPLQVAMADDATQRLASLFDAHHARLYRLARRLASSADDALDLVQETFLRAARSRESLPAGNTSREEAWLVRVLINIRRDQWRQSEIRKRHNRAEEDRTETAQRSTPESTLIAKTTVWEALDLLPPRRRAVVVLHELDAVPVSDIASLLGISAITVRWHLSGGRRDLIRLLKRPRGDTR